jgi:hypothetical protein
MDDHLTIFSNTVSKSEEEIFTIDSLLKSHPYFKEIDLERGHEFTRYTGKEKVIPSIKYATEEDAEDITKIFKEVYDNTYPYKKLESKSKILSMIRDPNYYWIVFKLKPNITIGCIGVHLDFEKKKANLFGFAFRTEFQHKVDIAKASIACMVSLVYKFRDRILIWYGEARSSFSSIQYITNLVGLQPIGFLPNKDIFFNHPESEFLLILYDRNVLFNLRNIKKPELISQAIFCYFYAFQKYNLELPTIKNYTDIESELNPSEIAYKKTQLLRKVERDEFGNELITFFIKGTDSYFQFQYYHNIKIAEKTIFKVSSIEELHLFLGAIKNFIITSKLRYFETYLSAYNSKHQALFYNAGFKPTGYIPAFKYNRIEILFEDQLVFVYHKDDLDHKISFIPETEEFLKTIKYFKKLHKE